MAPIKVINNEAHYIAYLDPVGLRCGDLLLGLLQLAVLVAWCGTSLLPGSFIAYVF